MNRAQIAVLVAAVQLAMPKEEIMSRALRSAAILALGFCFGPSSAHGQTASCPSVQPAPDWVCVEGGDWVPPDHPLAIAAQGPPTPGPPAACQTVQPSPNWVCVNDAWVPPDHPLATPTPVPETPLFLLVDTAHLTSVRDSMRRGEQQFQPALTALQAEADRQLTVAPLSVMHKRVTPPSGDKHDYMSQAPYWWPGPSEPDGKPYIRTASGIQRSIGLPIARRSVFSRERSPRSGALRI
jgi:hypothetical protein